MALISCTKCGHKVSTTAPKCPGCGTPPNQAQQAPRVAARYAAAVPRPGVATPQGSVSPPRARWWDSIWAIRRAFEMFVNEPELLLVPVQALAVALGLLAVGLIPGLGFVLWPLGLVYIAAGTWGCLIDATERRFDPWKFRRNGIVFFGRSLSACIWTLLVGLVAGVIGLVAGVIGWICSLLMGLAAVAVGMPEGGWPPTAGVLWLILVIPGAAGSILISFWFTVLVLMLWPAVLLSRPATSAFTIARERWRELLPLWLLHLLPFLVAFVIAGIAGVLEMPSGLLFLPVKVLAMVGLWTLGSLAALLYYRSIAEQESAFHDASGSQPAPARSALSP